jgi:MYXO-CTERM domain-containing protein
MESNATRPALTGMRLWSSLFALGLVALSATARAACPQQPAPPATQDFQGFKGRIFELAGKSMPYRLFIPENYDAGKPYPLVLYLHHAGLVGTDNCIQLTEEAGSGGYGGVFVHEATAENDSKFSTQQKYPHFLVAPQATNSSYGFGGGVAGSSTAPEHETRALVFGILDALEQEFNIDARRRYLTGISMGCYGTWDIIMRRPDYFAAASPQSCRGDPNQELLAKLVQAPIWSMCGTNDSYFEGAQAMADAMAEVGAMKFVFTPFQDVGHSIHNLGYDYPGFIDWMFAQSLPESVDPGAGGAGGTAGSGDVGGASASSAGASGAGAPSGGAGTSSAGSTSLPVGGATVVAGSGPNPVSTAVPASDGGCACDVAGAARGAPSWLLLALLLPLLWLRRYREQPQLCTRRAASSRIWRAR